MDIILKLTDGIYKCLIDDNAVLVVLERISYPRALNNYASLMKVTNETKWEISKQINKNKRIQTVQRLIVAINHSIQSLKVETKSKIENRFLFFKCH